MNQVFSQHRIMAFSDAVFAIAMTLLSMELQAPVAAAIESFGVTAAWFQQAPLFVAFLTSFFVIAIFWVAHMETWSKDVQVSPGLLWLLIIQLLFVVLMPFATRLYSEAFLGESHGAFAFYCLVATGISLFGWWQRRVIAKQRFAAADYLESKRYLLRAAVPLWVFAACIPLAFFVPSWFGGILFVLIFPVNLLAMRHLRKIAARAEEQPADA